MDTIPLLDPGLSGLHDARPAGVFPFLLEGESTRVSGVASRPGLRVGVRGREVAHVRPHGIGTAANLLLFPGMARRDFSSPAGTVVETALAMATLPLVVIQWDGTGAARPSKVEVVLPGLSPAMVGSRARVMDDGQVAVAGDPTPGQDDMPPLEIRLVPAATATRLEVDDGAVRAVFEPASEGHVSLVVAAGLAGRTPSVAPARHARSHAARAALGPTEGLLLATGIPEIDEGFAWLRTRLVGQARHLTPRADAGAVLSVGLAASAAGDRESSAATLAALLGASNDSNGGSGSTGDAIRGLLAARHAAVFGEASHARAIAARWVGDVSESQVTPVLALAAGELADALHLSGDPETVAKLRALAGSHSKQSAPTPGRSLPMAGRSSPTAGQSLPTVGRRSDVAPRGLADSPSSLRGLLAGDPAPAVTDPDALWLAWRTRLSDESGRIVTLWDTDADGEPDASGGATGEDAGPLGIGGSLTAQLILTLCSGLLGLRADAAVGRIRIAPRLPDHLTRFEATGITVGSSSITLRYSATREVLRYELIPESAAVPPLLVFEPRVSGSPAEVRVDGEAADLDPRDSGPGTIVPVQLPLDATRVVEIIRA